ncbi:MAG: YadA-like family protein [Alphaproteobacteria bacterium]|nr:YadA-like family protein [Alphaproteobacteria bacterium]
MHKLHGVLLGVSVLPALLIAPAMADAPVTDHPVFVFGDVTFDNQHVANGEAAFGGRRMDNWEGNMYQNDFPRYQMVGRSMTMSNSDAYIGPVTLTMRELTGEDAFAFNYQINEVDVDLANLAGVTWNQDYSTVFSEVSDIIGESNAGYTARPVYAMAQRDDSQVAGSLSFDNSTVMVDGATINANTISITNGSVLTFVKQDHSKLGAFLEGVIDSDGNTTLTADTMTVNNSQLNVNSGATLNITTTDTETGTTFSNLSTDKGALSVIDGSAHISGARLVFDNNTSSSHGAGLYYKVTDDGLTSSVVLDADSIIFSNNTSNYSASSGGALFNSGGDVSILGDTNTFTGNQILGTDVDEKLFKRGGGAIANQSYETESNTEPKVPLNATMVIGTANSTNTFSGNTSSMNGGAIMNRAVDTDGDATLTINGTTTFTGNIAALNGGAIYNMQKNGHTATVNLNNGSYTFTGNSATGEGGAIYNAGTMTIANAGFDHNSAKSGGAIRNISGATLTLNNADFTLNTTTTGSGAAIYSGGTLNIDGGTYSSNTAATSGGAIYMSKGTVANATFTGNNAASGGAMHVDSAATTPVVISGSTFTNNTATTQGGAINARSSQLAISNSSFEGNSSEGKAGALYLSQITTITDTSFRNNTAGTEGGAIYHYSNKKLTINADQENVEFSGNTANGVGNDIYASSAYTLYLNANTGRSISMDGGIVGKDASNKTTISINSDSTINGGTIEIANALKYATVTHSNGELHLINTDLTDTTISVASDATINTIDDLINDYVGKVYLDTGAIIAGDIDYANGIADMYSAAAGATEVNYRLANALNIGNGGPKTIHVVDGDVLVNSTAFNWFNSETGMTLASSGNADGDIVVTGLSGGLNMAVDITDETAQEVEYNLTAATETFDGTDNTIQNATFTITGNGNTEGSNTLVFGSDLIVDGNSELTLNDIVLDMVDGEEIQVAEGAALTINNAHVGVNLNNAGTLVSDPTYYDAQVVNSGTASFTGDIFESTASLINNGGEVSLTNVEFVQGSTVDGDGNGHLNIQDGQTIFDAVVQNNTLTMTSDANVVVGQHGSLDGVGITAAGGTINLNNGHIDALGDLVANGDVGISLDANFYSGEADTISHITGTGKLLINNINLLSSEYGDTEGYFSWTVAENDTDSVDFADGWTITGGTNYFTSITKDGQNITFGDKLMNASSVYAQLGSWDGEIIGTSTAYDEETNAYSSTAGTTVGAALTALESAVNGKQNVIVDSTTIVANGAGGFDVAAGSIGATQLAANSVASSNIIDGTIVNADIAVGTITTDRLADQNVSQFTNDAGYQTSSDVATAINTALANGGTNSYQTAENVATTLEAYSTTEQMNNAISDALANNGDAYQTSSQVAASISDALANNGDAYQTASQVNNTVNTAITEALGNGGAVASAITTSTTMAGDDDPDTALYSNFDEGASVTSAVASLDSAIGTTTAGTHVAATNNVGQNINALDSAIGSTTTGTHVTATGSVGQNLNSLDTALATAESNINANTAAIETLNGDENTSGSVRNIAKEYFDLASAEHDAFTLNQANAYTDERVEKLDKDLSAGIASAVALSSVAVSDVRRGELSVGAGYGYFNGQSAAAFGAAMGISNRWSVNAGAGVSGYDVSFRAGTNYKFKVF